MTHRFRSLLIIVLLAALSCVQTCVAETADIVIYGGTSAGIIAAIQAREWGKSVILIEPSQYLGGLTTGGLGATDVGNKQVIGGLSRDFYRHVKEYYSHALSDHEKQEYKSQNPRFSESDDAMWTFEPHIASHIFKQMLKHNNPDLFLGERLDRQHGVEKNGSRIESITMENGHKVTARMFIDATYEGDLMAAAGVSYHVGREANSVYDEKLNGVQTKRLPYNGHNLFRPLDPYVIPGDKSSGLLFGVQPDPPGEDGTGDRRVQAYCF